jgi:hypothetical protein
MTVAIMVKVFDGVVLAADSATTLGLANGSAQVWNNANKIFHLHRTKPIGAMTWGIGNVGDASIATLAKDLRRRFMGGDPNFDTWELPADYTMEWVTERLVDMIFDELYAPAFPGAGVGAAPLLGFLVAGFSCDGKQSEVWRIEFNDATSRPQPRLEADKDQSGWAAYAQPQAALRLLRGHDPALPTELAAVVPPANMPAVLQVLERLNRDVVAPSMPFADAIALARYLVDVTVGYSRAQFGPDTVGGPIEVAGISRHEGFKWISRKHYYTAELNPGDPHHDY